jgi:hypothetical protein
MEGFDAAPLAYYNKDNAKRKRRGIGMKQEILKKPIF